MQALNIEVSEEGVYIPKEYLEGFGNIAVIKKENLIMIKPRSMTKKLAGRIKAPVNVDKVLNSYTEYILDRGK